MANEVVCKIGGGRLRQVLASAAERQRLVYAIQELEAGQRELAELYAAKEGHPEGKFGFEQQGSDVVLVRIAEDAETGMAPAA